MSINGNNQVHSYTNETGCIYVMGNNNTINLKQCQAIINVMGNSNTFNLLQSMAESNVNGNGNNFILIGSAFKIGVNGNGNIVRNGGNGANGEQTNINVLYNNGTNNLLDGGSSNNQNFVNGGLQANQGNQGNYNYGSFNAPQQQQQHQSQQSFRNGGNGFQFGQMQYSPNIPNQHSYQFNSSGQWPSNPRSNNNNFTYSYNYNGNQQPQRGHYSFSYSPTFSFNGRQPEQSSPQNQGLSQNEISLLPVIQYEGASQKCSICLEEIKRGNKVVYLFCFHNFHEECGVNWFRRSATCPLCQLDIRQQIRENQ